MEEALISPLECSSCDRIMEQSEVYCTSCGYPQRGTEQQQSKFHAERILQMRESSDAKDRIKSARNTLFVIAAL
ncbi:MAG: putative membrane protein YvbJ, partial [Dokdonia sp.]